MGKEVEFQFGIYGKHIVDNANPPPDGTVYHTIRAVGGDATVTFTSASGTSFTGVTLADGSFDYDVFDDLTVSAGTVWAYIRK